jgi:septum formation protein
MTLPLKKPIILASKSPRRQQLLKEARIPFIVKTRSIDEAFPDDMPRSEVATYLAEQKAAAARGFLEDQDDILLTADSTVVMGDTILNKPANADEAAKMLRQISGRMHTVYTGVCLMSLKQKKVFTGISDVYFDPFTEEEIQYYIEQFQPFDKAGSYAIQEWIGLCKSYRIEGTFANIMGLPVHQVYRELQAMLVGI